MILKDRVLVISGANRGLGLAIAESAVREGASLYIGAREQAPLDEAAAKLRALAAPGARVEARRLDVADEASVAAFAAGAGELFGRVDALVNNAGVYGPKGRFEEVDLKAWDEALRINLFGVLLMCRAFLPLLRKSAKAKIINLSGGGATQPLPRLTAYAASKAGMVRLSETLAEELKDEGIEVNAVAPGALNTRLLDEVLEAGPDKVGKTFYERSLKQKAEGGTPLSAGADFCAWLASRESDGITGRLLSAVWDNWKGLPARSSELAKSDIYTLRRIVPKDRGADFGEPK